MNICDLSYDYHFFNIRSNENGFKGNNHILMHGIPTVNNGDNNCVGVGNGCEDYNNDGLPDCDTSSSDWTYTQSRINCMNLKDEIIILAHPSSSHGIGGGENAIKNLSNYTGVEISNGGDKGDHIGWWDTALSWGHKSYCFASDDYEDNNLDTGWILVNTAEDYTAFDRFDFYDTITKGNFYAVVPSKDGTGLKGPQLIFKVIDKKLFVILKKEGATNRTTITILGIHRNGELPWPLIENEDMNILYNDPQIYSMYAFDLESVDKSSFRGVRVEIRQEYSSTIRFTAFSQPYYLDCYCNSLNFNGNSYNDDHYFP